MRYPSQEGYIGAKRFKNSKNKTGYMYIITKKGAHEADADIRFSPEKAR